MPSLHLPERRGALVAVVCALGSAAAPVPAAAQPIAARLTCTNHGANLVEPLVERDGQSLHAAQATCVVHGGPLDGAVETQHNLWHYDKGTGTLLAGQAVTRKPGMLGAALVTQGVLSFQMTDGRVTGWTASGKGRQAIATGGAASALAGRSFSWTASPTGPRSYVLQVTYEP